MPTRGSFQTWPVAFESGPLAGTSVPQPQQPEHRVVSGNYFTALGIPVIAGRTFDDRDDVSVSGRAVISANFARIGFPGMPFDQVIGQRVRLFGRHHREIIGIVGDVTIDVYGTPTNAIYSAHRQFAADRNWGLTYVVATTLPSEEVLPDLKSMVTTMDPELVVHRPLPLADIVGRGISRERFALVLLGTFAAIGLTLASIGLYGVVAYSVRQRTQEIGIRLALGASASQIRSLVLRQAVPVIIAGLIVGTAGALVLGRSLSSLLFQIDPWDPRIFLATAAALTITSVMAAWAPALRASRVEPRTALQEP